MLKLGNSSLYLAGTIANLLAFASGVAIAWSSPMIPKLEELDAENPLCRSITMSEGSWIGAILSLGAIFGPIAAGPTVDKIGRKKTLIILAFPLIVGFLVMAFAKTVPLFFVARMLMGFSVGSVFIVVPMYLTEIAEDHNRGTLSCMMTVFIASGILFSYAVGPFLTVQNFCLVCVMPLLIYVPLFGIYNPETPQFFAFINDQEGLKNSLLKLRNKSFEEIQKEMLTTTKLVQELSRNKNGVKELFQSKIAHKGLIITVGLIVFQQLAGINAVLNYMQTIFNAAGSGLSPEISTIIVGIVQACTTILTSSLVDRLGRKILFLFSASGSCLSLFSLGTYFFLKDNTDYDVNSISWLPVVSLVSYIVSFNVGFAPLPWTVMAELFSLNVKAIALALTTAVCFTGAFIITVVFPSLSLFLGMGQCFWVFSLMCAASFIFIYCMLPETKGKSLQEIQRLLGK